MTTRSRHSAVALDCPRRRYSLGVKPVQRRTARLNAAGDAKPIDEAIVVTGRFEVASSDSARSRCTPSRIAENVVPSSARRARDDVLRFPVRKART